MCNVRIGFLFMEKYSGIKTVNASLVLDYEYIQMLRDADRKIPNPNTSSIGKGHQILSDKDHFPLRPMQPYNTVDQR